MHYVNRHVMVMQEVIYQGQKSYTKVKGHVPYSQGQSHWEVEIAKLGENICVKVKENINSISLSEQT